MGKIISVHSFRGGTGKSNLVANLAAALASQGKRVGIIDTDIQSPGIHVLFGLDLKQVKHTLNDYLMNRCPVQDTAFEVTATLKSQATGQIQTSHGSIYLIPSSMKVDEITAILSQGYDIKLLTRGYNKLIEHLNLDYLLIDTHPGINEEVLLSIGISDVLLVILRLDQQDYQGTALTVRVAKQLNVSGMGLVVNKVLPDFDFREVKQQVEQTYSAPVISVLPLDSDVIRLGSRDIFYLCFPDHPISQEIGAIAQWLMTIPLPQA